jgi:hypothetical protein
MTETRSTTLKYWGPASDSIADLEVFRAKVRKHILWLNENRAGLPVYDQLRKFYLHEFLKVSIQLSKKRLAEKQAKGKAA